MKTERESSSGSATTRTRASIAASRQREFPIPVEMFLMYRHVPANAVVLLAAAITLAAAPAIAQQGGASDVEPLREIVVTGSRIASANEVSTSPIQVISSKDIQVYGKTDITDLIN